MNIYHYNYETALEKMPELQGRMSLDFLRAYPNAKYTTGVKGIANVYIPSEDGFLIINEKNALYALVFAESIKRAETDPRFKDESRNFDKMIYSLMPQDEEVRNISDPFYRNLFKRGGIKDDVRNALNSKSFEKLFKYEVISRYVCTNSMAGSRYTEAEIAGLAEEIYQTELQSEMERTGSRGLNSLSRALVGERCAEALEAYGWKFDHREYGDVTVNGALLQLIREALPYINGVYEAVCAMVDEKRVIAPNSALIRLNSMDLNPIANSFIYARSAEAGLRQAEELVDWTEEDYRHWRKQYEEQMREEQLRDEYMRICVRDFVLRVNDMRNKEYDSVRFDLVVDEITMFIRNKQIRQDL